MTFQEWRSWTKSYKWDLRWFIFLVLIRPIIDNLYHLKNISPFLSPPYIAGVLTPVLAIAAIIKYRAPATTKMDVGMKWWFWFSIAGSISYYFYDPLAIVYIEFLLKLLMPFYLYFFIRLVIRNKQDLEGILQTYLYSAIFVAALFLFEVLIAPIRVEMSRGVERIQGNFADVMNYGFYITLGFLLVGYFFFKNAQDRNRVRQILIMAGVTALCCWGLYRINHVASYGVFIFLVMLFVYFNIRSNRGVAIQLAVITALVIAMVGIEPIREALNPLIKKDLEVYAGEKETDLLFHGRVGRWRYMLEEFFAVNMVSQFFGMPTSFRNTFSYISSGTHNDYLRILFLGGYFGFAAYLSFVIRTLKRIRKVSRIDQYIGFGGMGVLLLYSISANPTVYAPLLYIVLAIFAYLALPKTVARS